MALAVLGTIATIVVVALVAPVRIRLDLDSTRSPRPVVVEVRWLFIHVVSGRRDRRPRPPRRPQTAPAPRRWSLRWSPALVHRAVRLLRELLSVATPVTLEGHVSFGLDDPADTGMVFGLLMGISAGRTDAAHLHVSPDFGGPSLDVDALAAWSVRPIAVVWPVLTFVFTPAVWRSLGRRPRVSSAAAQA